MLVSACGPEPTPVAITPLVVETHMAATEQFVSTNTPIPNLRYGLLPNTQGYVPSNLLDSENFTVENITEQTTSEQFNAYDIVSGYGLYDGWQVSPVATRVSLVLNTAISPFDQPDFVSLMQSAATLTDITAQIGIPGVSLMTTTDTASRLVRETLANLGFADGIRVYGRIDDVPGSTIIIDSLKTVGIRVQTSEEITTTPHMQIKVWHNDSERQLWVDQFGENSVIDLYSIPISYLTSEDIQVSFDTNGWVIVSP